MQIEALLDESVQFLLFRLERSALLSKRPDGKYIDRQERRLISKLRTTWQKQQDFVLDRMKNVSVFRQRNFLNNALDDEIDRITNNLPGRDELVEDIIFYMRESMGRGGKTSVKNLKLAKFGISFDLQNKKAIDFLNAKKTLELSNYRGNIHTTTKDRLRKILLDAAKSGQSYQETAKLIAEQGQAGVFSFERGQLIATREIGIAYEKGKNIPVQEFQDKYPDRKVKKWWQTVNDDRVTPECKKNQEASEQRKGLDLAALFPSGDLTAPRAGNPRCRCFTYYQIQ